MVTVTQKESRHRKGRKTNETQTEEQDQRILVNIITIMTITERIQDYIRTLRHTKGDSEKKMDLRCYKLYNTKDLL